MLDENKKKRHVEQNIGSTESTAFEGLFPQRAQRALGRAVFPGLARIAAARRGAVLVSWRRVRLHRRAWLSVQWRDPKCVRIFNHVRAFTAGVVIMHWRS